MKDIDNINRELADVLDALNATPDDDFGRRHELRTRQDALRAQAAQYRVDADEQRTTTDLERELAALESQRDAVFESGVDLVTQAGGGSMTGGSFTSSSEGALNREIQGAADLGAVESRIAKLSQIIDDRSGTE